MAYTLLKTGITTGQSVEAWHVTQSIDAFSGLVPYNITLSGSFTLKNGMQGNDKILISDANGTIGFTGSYGHIVEGVDNFNSFTSSYNTGSFTGSFTGDGRNLTGVTASYAENFSNTNLTFTGNRSHNTNGNYYYIDTDGGTGSGGWQYIQSPRHDIGAGSSFTRYNLGSIIIFGSGSNGSRMDFLSSSIIVNQDGNNIDLRIEGDNDQNLLFLDASTDMIGIGKNNPNTKLDINGNITITGSINGNIGTNGSSRLSNGSSFKYTILPNGSSTNSATWSTVATIIPNSNERVISIEANISGRKISSPMSGSYSKLHATFLNSGSLSQIGTTTEIIDHNGMPTTDTRIISSGGNILVQAFGLSGENITWNTCINVYDLI